MVSNKITYQYLSGIIDKIWLAVSNLFLYFSKCNNVTIFDLVTHDVEDVNLCLQEGSGSVQVWSLILVSAVPYQR